MCYDWMTKETKHLCDKIEKSAVITAEVNLTSINISNFIIYIYYIYIYYIYNDLVR